MAAVRQQGFDEVMVPHEGEEAIRSDMLQRLHEEGVELLTATGEQGGRQRARGNRETPEYSLLPLLPHILLPPNQGHEHHET